MRKLLVNALSVTNPSGRHVLIGHLRQLAESLDGLPKEKMHCSNLGADALAKAIEDYESKKSTDAKKTTM